MPNDAGDRKIPDAASIAIAAAAAASVPTSRRRQVAQPSAGLQATARPIEEIGREEPLSVEPPTVKPLAMDPRAMEPASEANFVASPIMARAPAPVAASRAVWPDSLMSQSWGAPQAEAVNAAGARPPAAPAAVNAASRAVAAPPAWRPLAHRIVWPKVGRAVFQTVRIAAIAFVVWLAAMFVLIAAFAFVTPPGSALMALHSVAGGKIRQRWVPIERISPKLVRAVIASEDSRFCRHWGIDPKEIAAAIRRSRGGTPRGASTISMQVAKNMFLWPSKSYVRKALEVPLTLGIELMWSKRRIMEVYLNIVEWGPGVFGAESAARYHFKVPARKLSAYQASLLAVSLPNPRRRVAGKPSSHMRKVAGVVRSRMTHGRRNAACVLARK